jgi:hypothetical protein
VSESVIGFFERRAILHHASQEERVGLADRLLAAGALDDALDCLQAAGALERVAAMTPEAVAKGDPFLLTRIEKITGKAIPQGTWDEAIATAERSGKPSLGALARRYLASRVLS